MGGESGNGEDIGDKDKAGLGGRGSIELCENKGWDSGGNWDNVNGGSSCGIGGEGDVFGGGGGVNWELGIEVGDEGTPSRSGELVDEAG